MNRSSEVFVHHDGNTSPLEDIFIHSDRQDWTLKQSDIASTAKSKSDDNTKDASSVTDSLIDVPFLDDAVRTSSSHGTAFKHRCPTSIFATLHHGADPFSVITDPQETGSLCVDSVHLNADEDSEQTEFSGYFSETRTEKIASRPQPSSEDEEETQDRGNLTAEVGCKKSNDDNDIPKFVYTVRNDQKEVQKPPTTAGIGLEDLKAVFHLERPKAEKKLGLKRTTFSNLSRHYGISKWPFRTIRDSLNRMEANNRLLDNASVSKERRRKLQRQQKLLHDVINLIYSDPRHSRDSNTLAVLLMIVAARDFQ